MRFNRIRFVAVAVCSLTLAGALAVVAESQLDGRRELRLRNWEVPFSRGMDKVGTISAAAIPSAPSHFIALAPCRVADTRNSDGPFGGPMLTGGVPRSFTIPAGPCMNIPAAAAYSLNLAVTGSTPGFIQFLTAYPGGTIRPVVATMNFDGGETTSNAAIIAADAAGAVEIYASTDTHLILDINGYFAEGVVTSVTVGSGLSGGGVGPVSLSVAIAGINSTHLANNSVGPSAIATGAVGSDEIATNAVGSDEIATDAVGSAEVATNAINSSEIAPGAVDSIHLGTQRAINFRANPGTVNVVVLSLGGLTLTANCLAGPDLELIATTSSPASIASSIGDDYSLFTVGDSADVMSGDDSFVVGTLVYRNISNIVTAQWQSYENTGPGPCIIHGIATLHGPGP